MTEGNGAEGGGAPGAAAVNDGTLRFLKWLTIILTGTMILGIGAILTIIALRVPSVIEGFQVPPLPETIRLPAGADPEAFVATAGWFAVVVRDEAGEAILIFDRESGRLERRIAITRAPAQD